LRLATVLDQGDFGTCALPHAEDDLVQHDPNSRISILAIDDQSASAA
jgi:hypothetical protein